MEDVQMTTIYLKRYYPYLPKSEPLAVTDEIAATLSTGGRLGDSYQRRKRDNGECSLAVSYTHLVERPKLHSKGKYQHYGQWLGGERQPPFKEQIRWAIDTALAERPADLVDFLRRVEAAGAQVVHGRGGAISFRVPGQDRATRLRASTLGDGYGLEDVQAVIDGKAPLRKAPKERPRPAPRRVDLVIDIQGDFPPG